MSVYQSCQGRRKRIVRVKQLTITIPHAIIIEGSQMDGLNRFKSRFEGISKAAYVKKNTVTGDHKRCRSHTKLLGQKSYNTS